MSETKYFKNSIYIIILSALAGFSLMIFLTSKFGPAVSEDSISYIAAARNILNGRGVSILTDSKGNQLNLWLPWIDEELYHIFPWPPLFPFMIAIFGLAGFDLVESARFLNAFLFSANITLILLIIRKYTKSLPLIIFSSIIFISSFNLLQVHYSVWSEPLFLFLSLLGFYFLFYFLENNKIYNLLISSLSFSLAFFTRTLGISLIATGVISILLFCKSKINKKIIYSIVLTLIGILPSLIWNLKNKILYGYATPEFLINPLKIDILKEIVDTVSLWFYLNIAPPRFRGILLAIVLILIISTSIYLFIKSRKKISINSHELNSRIIYIFLIFIFFYMFFLLTAGVFFIANIHIDSRILIPIFISFFIIIVLLINKSLDYFKNNKNIKFFIFILCEIFIILTIGITAILARSIYKEGQSYGYNSKSWLESDTIRELRSMDIDEPVYTNNPYAVYYLSDRNSIPFPAKINIYKNKTNSNYTSDLNRTMEEIREKSGLIVLFDLNQFYLAEEKELLDNYELILIKDTKDGAIYKVK